MILMSPANLKLAQVDYKEAGIERQRRQSVLTLSASLAGGALVKLYI